MGYGKNPPQPKAKRESKREATRVPYSDFRFVRIELVEDEKEVLRALVGSGEFESLSADFFLELGYGVGFSTGDAGNTVICTVSMYNATHPNAGLRLTGRGRDAASALISCAYKHVYLCEDGMWRQGEDKRGGSTADYG